MFEFANRHPQKQKQKATAKTLAIECNQSLGFAGAPAAFAFWASSVQGGTMPTMRV
jgi:hypothetical protein